MKISEKIKVEKIISKIQNSNFDENDVEGLFMKLRAYTDSPIFREIADFVAHNDERDKGIVGGEIEAISLGVRFIKEFDTANKQLRIDQEFPAWVVKHLEYQINKSSNEYLMEHFKTSKKSLKSKIEKSFKINKKKRIAQLSVRNTGSTTKDAIEYLMGSVTFKEKLTQFSIFNSLLETLNLNKIDYDSTDFGAQENKVIIAILNLIHNTSYKISGNISGECKIGCDDYSPTSVSIANGGEGFGNLTLTSYVPVMVDGQRLVMMTPVITTELAVKDWLTDSMFYTEGEYERVKVNDDIYLDSNYTFCNVSG